MYALQRSRKQNNYRSYGVEEICVNYCTGSALIDWLEQIKEWVARKAYNYRCHKSEENTYYSSNCRNEQYIT